MGGSVSSGRDNDELIDNLVKSLHIKSASVERVFRAVDRGIFYLPSHKEVAYRDLAWREGNIHISAPCIYSEVMEALEINEGCSFLNIGSGTGYLSTMVGLMLGPYGVNHNIEIHADVIDYAKKRVLEFIKTAPKFDDFDFCIPKFIHGNCLNIFINDETLLYDRIYVGTGVTNEHANFIRSLLKINGILLMPLDDHLVQIKRKSQNEYQNRSLMTVSFASLVSNDLALNSIILPKLNPHSLQELCRYKIRSLIRESIKYNYPDYYKMNKTKTSKSSLTNQIIPDDNNDDARSPRNYQRRFFFGSTQISERQFRLLINGRLLNRDYNSGDDNDNDDDDDVNLSVSYNNNSTNRNNSSLEEETRSATEYQNNDDELSDNDEDVIKSSSTENLAQRTKIKNKARSDFIPIPQKDEQNKNSSSIPESGFAESAQSSISSDGNNINDKTNELSTDFGSLSSNDSCFMDANNNDSELNKLSINPIEISSKTDIKQSPMQFNEPENKPHSLNHTIETTIAKELNNISSSDQTEDSNSTDTDVPRKNYLRERILELTIPTVLKSYLLYNRDI